MKLTPVSALFTILCLFLPDASAEETNSTVDQKIKEQNAEDLLFAIDSDGNSTANATAGGGDEDRRLYYRPFYYPSYGYHRPYYSYPYGYGYGYGYGSGYGYGGSYGPMDTTSWIVLGVILLLIVLVVLILSICACCERRRKPKPQVVHVGDDPTGKERAAVVDSDPDIVIPVPVPIPMDPYMNPWMDYGYGYDYPCVY